MSVISEKQRKFLRTLAHARKPLVMIGASGLTEPVLAELGAALDAHELVKVRIRADDRDARDRIVAELAGRTDAVQVQRVGHVLTLYRCNTAAPKIVLPG